VIVDTSVARKWLVLENMSGLVKQISGRFIAKIAGTSLARHVTLLADWRPE
jgi:hypothetical protein